MNVYSKTAMWLMVVWTLGLPAATTVAAAPTAGQPAELSVGQPAPGFELKLLNGKKATVKEFKGKALLIVFWRSG